MLPENQNSYHYSVMAGQVQQALEPVLCHEGSSFVDATLGEGGHSLVLLSCFKQTRAVGVDIDATILRRAQERLALYASRIEFVNRWSYDFFRECVPNSFDGVLLDLGISTFHYQHLGRGFSFLKEEPLDMRLDVKAKQGAFEIVNQMREEDLANLFYELAQERYSRRYARAICLAREIKPIETTKELRDLIWENSPRRYEKTHPATKVFQALRIYVNQELSLLQSLLLTARLSLKKEGRFVVITFHSLEDRIVKHAFRRWVQEEGHRWKLITKKALKPTAEEIIENSASRSAKIRIVQRIEI